jgi:hypothetical protein
VVGCSTAPATAVQKQKLMHAYARHPGESRDPFAVAFALESNHQLPTGFRRTEALLFRLLQAAGKA